MEDDFLKQDQQVVTKNVNQCKYTSMNLSNFTDFNKKEFHNECKAIIEQIKGRFIDLAPGMLDDENDNYIDQIQEKTAKFKDQFDAKLQAKNFEFGKEFLQQGELEAPA